MARTFSDAAASAQYYKDLFEKTRDENEELRKLAQLSAQAPPLLESVRVAAADDEDPLDEQWIPTDLQRRVPTDSPQNNSAASIVNGSSVNLQEKIAELIAIRKDIAIHNASSGKKKKEKALAFLKRVYPKHYPEMCGRLTLELEKVP